LLVDPGKEIGNVMSLHYSSASTSTYRYLRKCGIRLPGSRTVREWLAKVSLNPGLNSHFNLHIKAKCDSLDDRARRCVIAFDEMSIMKNLEYNSSMGVIEGFVDMGNLSRSSKLGTHAFVVFLRGIFVNWKIPLSYYIRSGASVEVRCYPTDSI